MLTMQARKQFGLVRDPFTDDVQQADDVYLTESHRFAAEYFYQTAKVGGMLAIIGESGSGKTTVRRLAIDRMNQEGQKVKVIAPRIIDKGRLTASLICDAIIADCSTEHPKRTLEAKARQIERILMHSSRSGWSHVLVIEEAHDITIQTLKYLKRFWELEDGFKKLLAIVLVAQPEMKAKLDESSNWEAREVIRRMEIVEIEPLDDGKELSEYLALKFRRVGADPAKVMTTNTGEALAMRLRRQGPQKKVHSIAYPLLVNNWMRKALNLAAELGAKQVDAEIIGGI